MANLLFPRSKPPSFSRANPTTMDLERIIEEIADDPFQMDTGMRIMMKRKKEFNNELAAKLTGIALNPVSKAYLENRLDDIWSASSGRIVLGNAGTTTMPEVIIGSGFHAAVYAAIRVQAGFPKPFVLERGKRAGGVFAVPGPAFFLNSRNRPGGIGLAGDSGANPNYLPGAPIQTANISSGDYQTNADMALVIRLTLAKYANVLTEFPVSEVDYFAERYTLLSTGGRKLQASRIIDARGLGDPLGKTTANGTTILTFPQFMERMGSETWPLRDIRRAAVLGSGDAARCSLEALLGIGPLPAMSIPALDMVDRVDAYGELPDTMESWCDRERGRYNKIGRFLRPDRFGIKRLNVYADGERPSPVSIPNETVLVNGRSYDLVILATGNREESVPGLGTSSDFERYNVSDVAVATRSYYSGGDLFRVGPHARLGFSRLERNAGVAEIPNNAVSMFRLASKTATLAATLPGI